MRLPRSPSYAQRPVRAASVPPTRREAISLASLVLLSAVPTLPVFALDGGVTADAARIQSEAMGVEAAGGLKAGTGRPLNALIKMRAETGVQRTGAVETPLFKPGQCFDELKTARGAAEVAFSFPEAWTMATGPNLDVRDVKTSDSSFVLAAPLPDKRTFESLKDAWFMEVIFNPLGKYGSYGAVEERKVVSSSLVPLRLPSGGEQAYRRMSLKFAPLTYNMNTVERRALVSATAVGGTVFILVSGSLATRFKAMQPELMAVQDSFRVLAVGGRRTATGNG